MYEAIEIVQAMYDEAMAQYNAIPSYIMASEATLERIETLEEVLHALKDAEERKRKAMEERCRACRARMPQNFANVFMGGCDD